MADRKIAEEMAEQEAILAGKGTEEEKRMARLELAGLCMEAGHTESAVEHLKQLGILEEEVAPNAAEIYVALGKGLYRTYDCFDIEPAVKMWEKALREDRENWQAHALIGVAKENEFVSLCCPGQPLTNPWRESLMHAVESYKKAVELAPDRAQLRVRLGKCLGYLEEYAPAEESYLSALKIDASSEEAILNLTYLRYNLALQRDPSLLQPGEATSTRRNAAEEIVSTAKSFAEKHGCTYRVAFVLEFVFRRLRMDEEAEAERSRACECFRHRYAKLINQGAWDRFEAIFREEREQDLAYLNPLVLIEQYTVLAQWLVEAGACAQAEQVYLWLLGHCTFSPEGGTIVQRWLSHVFNDSIVDTCEGGEGGDLIPLDSGFMDALIRVSLQLAGIYERMGEGEKALEQYRQWLEWRSTGHNSVEAPWGLFSGAELQMPHYEYHSNDKERNDLAAYLGICRICSMRGEYESFRTALRRVISLVKSTPRRWRKEEEASGFAAARGLLQYNLPDEAFRIAAALLRESADGTRSSEQADAGEIQQHPAHRILWAILVAQKGLSAYADQDLMDPLRNLYESHAFPGDENGQLWVVLSLLYSRTGRGKSARIVLDRLLEVHPESAGAHMVSGIIAEEQGRIGEAEKSFRHCLKYAEDERLPLYRLALTQAIAGNLPGAEQTLRSILEIQQTCVPARLFLGVLKKEQGDAEEALRLIGGALNADPCLSEGHHQLAHLHFRQENFGHAVEHLETAILTDPANRFALARLAEHYGRWMEQNRVDRIDESLKRISRVLPDRQETIRMLLLTLTAVARYRATRHHDEIRTRLHTHKGHIRTIDLNLPLLQKHTQDQAGKYIERIKRACDEGMRELKNVGRLLQISNPKKQEEDLSEVLREAIEESLQGFQKKGCRIEFEEMDRDRGLRVSLDREQIKTLVFRPLIENARDAMESGGTLHITAEVEDDAIYARFCDNGCGLPDGFDPESKASTKGGEAWGVWHALRAMEAHEGNLQFENNPNGGATVTAIFHTTEATPLPQLQSAPPDDFDQTLKRLGKLVSLGLYPMEDPGPVPPQPVLRDVNTYAGIIHIPVLDLDF